MIDANMIPDEVVEEYMRWEFPKPHPSTVRKQLAAALNAWPSALRLDGYEYGVQDVIHLPLPKEGE